LTLWLQYKEQLPNARNVFRVNANLDIENVEAQVRNILNKQLLKTRNL
jgi:hypothetical protein